MADLRIGLGVDAHAFEDGLRLVLGGVAIDFPSGLAGHSDGDVIAHALTDAVLGAAGLGDIGSLFPADDPRWHGADSLHLLRDAYARVREAGYELVNADCILIGEEPRIAPHREEMRHRLAGALGVEPAPRQRPRDDNRPPRLHRQGRGPRGAGGRAPGAHMKLYSQAERPELLQRRDELGATWEEFMHHDAVASVCWDRQYEEYPDLQLWLVDDDDRLIAESNAVAIPVRAGRAARRRLGRGARSRRSTGGPRRRSRRSRSRSVSTTEGRASARRCSTRCGRQSQPAGCRISSLRCGRA